MFRKSWLDHNMGKSYERYNNLRGRDDFIALDWQDASDIVSKILEQVITDYGNQAIFAGSYGWSSTGRFHHPQSQLKRFLNIIGGFTNSVNTYSFAAAEVIIPHILGNFSKALEETPSWYDIAHHGELVVAFGGTPLKNAQVSSGGLGSHDQEKWMRYISDYNIRCINISPICDDMPSFLKADNILIRPNSDTALMLALCYVLYDEQLYNYDFIKKYTVGFEKFLPYLLGKKDNIAKTPHWASQICDIKAQDIICLARKMARSKTVISVSWSLTRQEHGEQPFWMAVTLAAMLGQIGCKGCGIAFGYSATNSIGDHYQRLAGASLPQGNNHVEQFIPVARIVDALENPYQEFMYNGKTYYYPDIKMIYWVGGNPFHHHQDLPRLYKAWQKPETIICHEWCWNSLAKFSDIILPCSTSYEREDIALATRSDYAIYISSLHKRSDMIKDDHDIFVMLAQKLGVVEKFTENKSKKQWIRELYEKTRDINKHVTHMPEFDDFQQKGYFQAILEKERTSYLQSFRDGTYDLPTPSGKIEIFSQTINNGTDSQFYGHAAFYEPLEWLGNNHITKKYPYHLISNQPADKLHSQLDHSSYSQAFKINGQNTISIHPNIAVKYDIEYGDYVKIYNARGACICCAILNYHQHKNTLIIPTGAWLDPIFNNDGDLTICQHGNANMLSPDYPTSQLAQGPAANSCLVNIEKISPITNKKQCYQPPNIIEENSSSYANS